MDPEFRENRRRQRAIIAVGVVLALVAGGAATLALLFAMVSGSS